MAQYYWDPATGSADDWTITSDSTGSWRKEIAGGALEFQPTGSGTFGGTWLFNLITEVPTEPVEIYYEGNVNTVVDWRDYAALINGDIAGTSRIGRFFGFQVQRDIVQVAQGDSQSGGAVIASYVPNSGQSAATRHKFKAYKNGNDSGVKGWLATAEEPSGWGAEGSTGIQSQAGVPGFSLSITDAQIYYLYGFGVGTDGDPAPTGPVGGVSAEPFLLRHNPRTNKVIPVLSSPTVTDIGATCVRPRVTKGF